MIRNKIRWAIRKAIRASAPLRAHTTFPCPVRNPHSIAYFASGGIGDILMAWPAICLVQARFPQASIDLLVPAPSRQVIEAAIKNVRVLQVPSTGLLSWTRLRRYDCALTNTIASFYLALELNASICSKYAYGFRYPDEPEHGRLFFATIPVDSHTHDIDQNAQLAAHVFGFDYTPSDNPYAVSPPAKQPLGSTVLLHPGAGAKYLYKRWPAERFAAVAQRLAEQGHDVRVLCGPDEPGLAAAFSSIPGIAVVMAPSPDQLIDEIRSARLFIGNDSGPAHLAAFYNVPAITLIGPVDPKRTAPRNPRGTYIYNAAACAPCHFNPRSCSDNHCMKSISVEQVWQAVERLL